MLFLPDYMRYCRTANVLLHRNLRGITYEEFADDACPRDERIFERWLRLDEGI